MVEQNVTYLQVVLSCKNQIKFQFKQNEIGTFATWMFLT